MYHCIPSGNFTYTPLQPDVKGDFPSVSDGEPRIPHVLHQTYKTDQIPSIYWDNIRSLVKHHPSWKYYFWSDSSARKLIAERHPYLLETYDNYDISIKRGDALRYVVLYEFGGVYLDMDFEVLRPFDRATRKYASIIAPEVFEHTVFLYNFDFLLMNCIMFTRPNHPFFKKLIEQLVEASRKTRTLVYATGPMFLTNVYKHFYNIVDSDRDILKTDCTSNSPYFYKGVLSETHTNSVYVPNTYYFNDQIDFGNGYERKFTDHCKNLTKLSELHKRCCSDMFRRGMKRNETTFVFTKHKWSHIYQRDTSKLQVKNISELVPNAIIYL